jgi:hypothetical protein
MHDGHQPPEHRNSAQADLARRPRPAIVTLRD